MRLVNWVKFPNEEAFTNAVVDLAQMAGWLVHHDRGEMRKHIQGHTGFPDLVLARQGRIIFAELKQDGKEPTPAQQRWLDEFLLPLGELQRLANDGGRVYVKSVCWHPADWELIVKALAGDR